MHLSPLRYPGGKNRIANFIAQVCVDNRISGLYVEPYAGGASVALFLLFSNVVRKIIINDKDRSIYAFWYSVLHHTDKLCQMIIDTEINVENWHKQKKVQSRKKCANLLELGFSTLFLNRTNRSGIISGGIIGGVEQKGEYKIDCRFNKLELISRIRQIAKRKKYISVYNLDAISLVHKIEKQSSKDLNNALIYFDPPYYKKGGSLYLNHYIKSDHKDVADAISILNYKWIVSYDNVPEIYELYKQFRNIEYSLKHTAHSARDGGEVLFFQDNLIIPNKHKNPIEYKQFKGYLSY